MSEITKPIMLDETGKEIIEALKGISRHAETADMASDSEKLGGKEPSEYLGTGDVHEWAKQPNKPTYTASEVGALPSDGKAVDSDKLNGHPASDFATTATVTALADDVDRHAFGEQSGSRNLTEIYAVSAIGEAKLSSTPLEVGVYTVSGYTPQTGIVADIYGDHVTGGVDVIFAENRWSKTINVSQECDVYIYCGSNYDISELQIEKGSSASPYEPYIESNKFLTNRIDRDFELERFGYVCPILPNGTRNFVDSDGVFHRRVKRIEAYAVFLAKDTTTRPVDGATIHAFYGEIFDAKTFNNSVIGGIYMQGFTTIPSSDVDYGGRYTVMDNIVGAPDQNYRAWIFKNSCNNMSVSDFRDAMKGKYIYYELATEETYSAYDCPSTQSIISDEWDSAKTYAVGAYVIDENQLYKCIVQNSGQKPKTANTYWKRVKVTDAFSKLNLGSFAYSVEGIKSMAEEAVRNYGSAKDMFATFTGIDYLTVEPKPITESNSRFMVIVIAYSTIYVVSVTNGTADNVYRQQLTAWT